MRTEHLQEWIWEHRSEEAAKVKEAEVEAEGETSGSEERDPQNEEGTADGLEERDTTKW